MGGGGPETLRARYWLAFNLGACGDLAPVIRLLRQLELDRTRVLGASHPDTIKSINLMQDLA